VTLEGYRLTRAAPGYDPELDTAVVLDTGEFAAYCIMWLDPVNKIAEFEPVGTRKAYRGKGYGKALLLDGFTRLRGKGMDTALVYCYAHNLPFYTSAGFEVVDKYIGFELMMEEGR
jgi:GNAT superfamily N-acetyltransferase